MDMESWRRKFLWQMAFFVVVLLAMAAGAAEEIWFFRAKFLAAPLRMLLPTAGMVFALGACLVGAGFCVKVIFETRKHEARMRALQSQRRDGPVPLKPMSPEQKEQYRQNMVRTLSNLSPNSQARVREVMESGVQEAAAKMRAAHGATPEVEAAIAEAEELRQQVLTEVDALPSKPGTAERPRREGLLDLPNPATQALSEIEAWSAVQAERGDGFGRVVGGVRAVIGRFTAASPAARFLRLMPALNSFLTLFSFFVIAGAVEHGRHTHEAVGLGICTIGLWIWYFSQRRSWQRGEGAPTGLEWWMEWGLGIVQTRLLIDLVEYVLSPSRPRASASPPFPLHLLAWALLILCVVTLLAWWVLALWDLFRPRTSPTVEQGTP